MNPTGNRGTQQQQGYQGGGTRTAESGGVLGTVAEKAQEMASSVTDMAGDAWDATRNAASAVATTAGDAYDEVARFMRRYPMATFCAGFGLGFLLGCALRSTGMGGYLRGDWAGYPAPSSSGYPFTK